MQGTKSETKHHHEPKRRSVISRTQVQRRLQSNHCEPYPVEKRKSEPRSANRSYKPPTIVDPIPHCLHVQVLNSTTSKIIIKCPKHDEAYIEISFQENTSHLKRGECGETRNHHNLIKTDKRSHGETRCEHRPRVKTSLLEKQLSE